MARSCSPCGSCITSSSGERFVLVLTFLVKLFLCQQPRRIWKEKPAQRMCLPLQMHLSADCSVPLVISSEDSITGDTSSDLSLTLSSSYPVVPMPVAISNGRSLSFTFAQILAASGRVSFPGHSASCTMNNDVYSLEFFVITLIRYLSKYSACSHMTNDLLNEFSFILTSIGPTYEIHVPPPNSEVCTQGHVTQVMSLSSKKSDIGSFISVSVSPPMGSLSLFTGADKFGCQDIIFNVKI